MPYLVDTNVLSELRKSKRADPNVLRWRDRQPLEDLYISVMTIGEIRQGIVRLEARDPVQAAALEVWRLETLEIFGRRILPVSLEIAERWAGICPKQPLPPIDGILAATALEDDLTMVTRNIGDFLRAGVAILNPFE